MNQEQMLQMWDHFRQLNGIALRAVEGIPEAKFDTHPIPGMRTPKELVVHLWGMTLKSIITGAARGEITDENSKGEKLIAAGLRTKTELLAYCRECWTAADQATQTQDDSKLLTMVRTPWGVSFPAFECYGMAQDEFIHHRGQLFAYLRAMGADVPNMWDFEHNAPEFQPRVATKA